MGKHKFSFSYLLGLLPFRFISLLKFGITGSSGLLIDFSLTWIFKDELHINKFVANSIGFSAAVISNYFINRYWTFSERDRVKVGRQLPSFILVSLIGLALNSCFIYILNELFFLNFYLSKAIAVILVFFWNFTANYFFVFKTRNSDGNIKV
jgi:putative flippase GtrA